MYTSRNVVGRAPTFQHGDPGSIFGGVEILISILGLGVLFVLSLLSQSVAPTLF